MNIDPNKDTSSVPKDDETTSRTSSLIQRIQRRREEGSGLRRSLSRKSLQSKQQSLQISKFYTKMASKNPEPPVTPTRENNLLARTSQKQPKKRSPTPLPGKAKKQSNHSPPHQLQTELELAELGRKLENERLRKIAAESRAEAFQKELRIKIRRIKDLEQELAVLRGGSKQGGPQLLGDEPRQKLNQSGMQRLKSNFLQIRIQELEKTNSEFASQLTITKNEVQRLKVEYQTLKEENELFKHEIFTLSQQSESAILCSKQREIKLLEEKLRLSTSEREVFLGRLLEQCEQEKLALQGKLRCLQLKIAFINRKQNEELRDVVKKKDRDIAAIRRKLSLLANESLKYRQQIDAHRYRQSYLAHTHSRSLNSDSCSFSLSPEHDNF